MESQKEEENSLKIPELTEQDKEEIIKVYFEFKEIVEKRDPVLLVEYQKKESPANTEYLQKEFEKDPSPESYSEIFDYYWNLDGFYAVTNEMLRSPDCLWEKFEGGQDHFMNVTTPFEFKAKEDGLTHKLVLHFIKKISSDNKWYLKTF